MDNTLNHLRTLLRKGRIIPVIGTGVSYSSTKGNQLTLWKGLLENGVGLIERSHSGGLNDEWAIAQKDLLEGSSATTFIQVADNLVNAMGGRQSARFTEWIKSTVGSLHVSDKIILDAIGGLGPFVATTNYDTLIEEVVGCPPVTWRNHAEWQKVITGDSYGVLHIHGCWNDPTTIVLDSNSYQEVTGDHFLQASLQSLLFTHSLMFIGFGSGLQDPNFSRLLDWLRKWAGNSPYGHFRLIRSSELADIKKMHLQDDRILPVVYGDNYSDLPVFLSELQEYILKSKPDLRAKKKWRCLEEMTYIMMRDTPEFRQAFFDEIAKAFFLSKGEDQSGEVCVLYNLEKRTIDRTIIPVVKMYSNDPHFLSILRERVARALIYGNKMNDPSLSPEQKMTIRQEFGVEALRGLKADWTIKHRTNLLGEDFKTLKIRSIPEKKLIEVETIITTSVNPKDYPNNVATTSELLHFITSCCAMSTGILDGDLLVKNPRLVSFVIAVLDKKSINMADIRYNSDSPEEWLYMNNSLGEEIGDYLGPAK